MSEKLRERILALKIDWDKAPPNMVGGEAISGYSFGWRAAIQSAAAMVEEGGDVASLKAEIQRLNDRLENNRVNRLVDGKLVRVDVKPGSIPDGIECRNETIKGQDRNLKAQQARIAALEADRQAIKAILEPLKQTPQNAWAFQQMLGAILRIHSIVAKGTA